MAATALTLSSGHQMPAVGLGVWRMDSPAPAIRGLIHSALRAGYRHFDCAAYYQNEAEVGDALAEAFQTGLVKRADLFITNKNSYRSSGVGTTPSALGDDGVLDIDASISLETTWHVMEDLVSMGLVRSIGISNYDIFLTRDCLAYAKIKPAVNQIETHPYFQRDSLVKFCQKHGICVTAHTPLSGSTANTERFGSVSCLDDPVIKSLAGKYGKTPVQLVLRWGLQRNTVVIPKTSKVERLDENLAVFDFDISGEDMDKIKALDRNYRTNNPAKFWGIDLYA
ncbi:hypothetical protein QYE76_019857 [Lolium multiflorum]|uniref:NADP-dependent oxidoreductase domain-containing protein n=1 Tax=Lolium multiflorum TaxID=4521 RepID=A0AAD8R3N5_LOLMU|nr:hypothetical protein QYE76_019857 [Lolium multiflorum]